MPDQQIAIPQLSNLGQWFGEAFSSKTSLAQIPVFCSDIRDAEVIVNKERLHTLPISAPTILGKAVFSNPRVTAVGPRGTGLSLTP